MFEILPLLDTDVTRVMRIEMQSFADEHWSANQIKQQLLNQTAINIGVSVQDDLVGYALVGSVLDEAELYQIALLPNVRRQGIASILLTQLCKQLQERGIKRLLLEVREKNLPAIRLYESFGFMLDGRRKEYYLTAKGKEDALLYSYNIQTSL